MGVKILLTYEHTEKIYFNLFIQLQKIQRHSILKQHNGEKTQFSEEGGADVVYEEISSVQRCRFFKSENEITLSDFYLFHDMEANIVKGKSRG